jgi:hypothetical protein
MGLKVALLLKRMKRTNLQDACGYWFRVEIICPKRDELTFYLMN